MSKACASAARASRPATRRRICPRPRRSSSFIPRPSVWKIRKFSRRNNCKFPSPAAPACSPRSCGGSAESAWRECTARPPPRRCSRLRWKNCRPRRATRSVPRCRSSRAMRASAAARRNPFCIRARAAVKRLRPMNSRLRRVRRRGSSRRRTRATARCASSNPSTRSCSTSMRSTSIFTKISRRSATNSNASRATRAGG